MSEGSRLELDPTKGSNKFDLHVKNVLLVDLEPTLPDTSQLKLSTEKPWIPAGKNGMWG